MKYKFLLSLFISQSIFASTQLVILGSGTPNPNPERGGSAYAVIVDNTPYLVDFGPGAIRSFAALMPAWGGGMKEMDVTKIEHAFLTHIHSDHTTGLSDLLLTPWIMGRENKLNLYGPKGLEKMAGSLLDAYADDIDYRVNGTQPSNGTGYQFNFTELADGVVFQDINLKVEAFKVNHGDFEDAYGFRFTSKDKVIVFSGDTGPSKSLERYAKALKFLALLVTQSLQPHKSKYDDLYDKSASPWFFLRILHLNKPRALGYLHLSHIFLEILRDPYLQRIL